MIRGGYFKKFHPEATKIGVNDDDELYGHGVGADESQLPGYYVYGDAAGVRKIIGEIICLPNGKYVWDKETFRRWKC